MFSFLSDLASSGANYAENAELQRENNKQQYDNNINLQNNQAQILPMLNRTFIQSQVEGQNELLQGFSKQFEDSGLPGVLALAPGLANFMPRFSQQLAGRNFMDSALPKMSEQPFTNSPLTAGLGYGQIDMHSPMFVPNKSSSSSSQQDPFATSERQGSFDNRAPEVGEEADEEIGGAFEGAEAGIAVL